MLITAHDNDYTYDQRPPEDVQIAGIFILTNRSKKHDHEWISVVWQNRTHEIGDFRYERDVDLGPVCFVIRPQPRMFVVTKKIVLQPLGRRFFLDLFAVVNYNDGCWWWQKKCQLYWPHYYCTKSLHLDEKSTPHCALWKRLAHVSVIDARG